jgi:Uma2 family endonuclease
MSMAMLPRTLQNGDRLTQKEFHRLYENTPEGFRAELIGGVVYVSSPLGRPHGLNHLPLGSVLFWYEANTPGVEAADNTTVMLGEEGEPQPDLLLRILPEYGGQSQTSDDNNYITNAPELIAEISDTSRSLDLHGKLDDYRRYGVLDYLVVCVAEKTVRWFDLSTDRELPLPADGIIRSRVFPGLWIDTRALLKKNSGRLLRILNQGLATPEHAEFVERLAAAHAARQSKKRPPRNGAQSSRRSRKKG